MTKRSSPWPAGVPCWADLMAPDVGAAQAFYAAVLGWQFHDTAEEHGGYAVAHRGGDAAAGIGPMSDGARTAWTLYLASDDADATAAAVTGNGGTLAMPPGDVGGLGRMFVATDPAGAAFGVWQAGTHIGASLVNEPGGMVWEDLRSTDPERARAFYTAVFGWRTEALEMAGPDYTTFSLPDESFPLGGMGGLMGQEGASSHWLVYFAVSDAAAAVAAATAGGGAVLAAPFDTPYGTMAGLADPGGAPFHVLETAGHEVPGRTG